MKILFNASVILAGVCSPTGASAALIEKAKAGQIEAVISELIFNEALRHSNKIGVDVKTLEAIMIETFEIYPPPKSDLVDKYRKSVVDEGDAHVLGSYESESCDVLVTLDKKHLLILQGKLKGINILSPAELLTH